MPTRPPARPLSRALAGTAARAAGGGGGGSGRAEWLQQVVDPGFSTPGDWTLSGSGIGTSAVTGGVLQITSTTNVYFALPLTIQAPLDAGVYTVTYTILTYVTGSLSSITSTNSALSGGVAGATRSANGTYTDTLTLPLPGYIGLSGQGAAIVDSMQVDNFTIQRVA